MDVTVVGGFWRLKFCFFSSVVVVVVVGGGFSDLSCGFSYGYGLLGLI